MIVFSPRFASEDELNDNEWPKKSRLCLGDDVVDPEPAEDVSENQINQDSQTKSD